MAAGPHNPLVGGPGALPAPLTRLVGRERAVARVVGLLATTRLLTLTGAGGVGKTRVAIAAARELAASFPDGVAWVDLAPLADSALVPRAVAAAFGLPEAGGRSPLEALAAALGPRRALAVVDNAEHVVDAAAHLLGALLTACPGLAALVTSREPLGLTGETTWRVPSLDMPGPGRPPAPDELAGIASAALFLDRARAALPDFALTEENAPAVAEVCRRLDGIPLALELAAARVRALPVEQVARRLDDRFRLLTGGGRTALPRHQTLRATVDWSHALLTEDERALLGRLAVFAGGWALEAAEAIGEGIAPTPSLDLLGGLVAKSLVQLDEGAPAEAASGGRYRLLETVRQYAAEKLAEAGEEPAVRDRHAAWCAALAERIEPAVWGGDGQLAALARLEAEHDNLRAALAWSLEHDPAAGLRLAGSLSRFWGIRAYWTEGQRWLEHLLVAAPEPTPARVRALLGAGQFAAWLHDVPLAGARYAQALALGRELGEERLAGWTLREWAFLVLSTDPERARRMLAEGEALMRRAGDRRGLAATLVMLGREALASGELARARGHLEESLVVGREVGDRHQLIDALGRLAAVAYADGDPARARAAFDEGLALARELGTWPKFVAMQGAAGLAAVDEDDPDRAETLLTAVIALGEERTLAENIAFARQSLSDVARRRGDLAGARALLRESVTYFAAAPVDRYSVATCLARLATIALTCRRAARAARLLGAAEALRRTGSWYALQPEDRPVVEGAIAEARAALGGPAFEAAWAAGAAVTPEQAVAEALAEDGPASMTDGATDGAAAGDVVRQATTAGAAPGGAAGLTRREAEVLRLLAAGRSNRAIAADLSLSVRTVERHIANLYLKIDVANRAEASAYAVLRGLA